MDTWVRYYSPAFDKPVFGAVPVLATEIWDRHRIETEVISVNLVPSLLNGAVGPDEADEKRLYDRDFVPRWRVLNPRTGKKISKELRSKSGNHFVAGVVAICSAAGLEWFATPGDQFAAYDADRRLGFLKALLAEGPALLASTLSDIDRD